jgi:hypothetical protein
MTILWPDPMSQQELEKLRDLATRVLIESDPNELDELIAQMTQIVDLQLRTRPPD